MMRVAMIDPSLFTLPYDRALAMGLGRAGHQVTLHGRRAGAVDGASDGVALVDDFYRVTETKLMRAVPRQLRLAAKGMDHAVSMFGLLRRLRRDPPDIIHFQWLALPLLDRQFLGALRRLAPLVLTVHDTNPFNGDPAARMQGLGFLPALRRFDALIVHTGQGYERLRARGLPAERMTVLPHGLLVDAPPILAAPQAVTNDTTTTFLLFGKMKPYKGIDLLIEAFARMPPGLRARARMRVIGKPYMDLAPLYELATRLDVADRLDIEPRFVADPELPSLFVPGTVAVFPYREIEASGVLALATAYGRPVIASRLGGFAEAIVDGENGHLVAPGDVPALSAALVHMLDDPEFAVRCGSAMQRAAQAVPGWEEIGRRTVSVYQAAQARWAGEARISATLGRSDRCRAMQ